MQCIADAGGAPTLGGAAAALDSLVELLAKDLDAEGS